MPELRVIFWGTSAFAVPALRSLAGLSGVRIVAVVAQPDKPQGRHGDVVAGPVAAAAHELGLPLLRPEKLKEPAFEKQLRELAPDVAVVAAYGRIIPETPLTIPRLGTLNIHPSLLPRWRGPSPIQAAIAHGDPETGVSIMLLDAEMDHGPLLAQTRVPLAGDERYPALEARLAEIGAALLAETLPAYASGSLTPQPQDHAAATVCSMLDRDSGRIHWQGRAADIERLERAYDPWPGIWTEWSDNATTLRVKLFDARVEPDVLDPGKIFEKDGRLHVGCADGDLTFGVIQVEGRKRMALEELLRGMPTFLQGRFF